jgi:hypothetical protein
MSLSIAVGLAEAGALFPYRHQSFAFLPYFFFS